MHWWFYVLLLQLAAHPMLTICSGGVRMAEPLHLSFDITHIADCSFNYVLYLSYCRIDPHMIRVHVHFGHWRKTESTSRESDLQRRLPWVTTADHILRPTICQLDDDSMPIWICVLDEFVKKQKKNNCHESVEQFAFNLSTLNQAIVLNIMRFERRSVVLGCECVR